MPPSLFANPFKDAQLQVPSLNLNEYADETIPSTNTFAAWWQANSENVTNVAIVFAAVFAFANFVRSR